MRGFHWGVLHVALIEPEIAWNTGNAGRTCLAAGAQLHLVGPLGFSLDEKAVRRAGLDYWKHVAPVVHADFSAFEEGLALNDVTLGRSGLAGVFVQLGDTARARAEYERALDLSPANFLAWGALADLERRERRFREAATA